MAICRCKEKHSPPQGRKEDYVTSIQPIGYPNTSSICGRKDCDNPGVIWLTKVEHEMHQSGIRTFSYASAVSKVKVI